MMLRKSTPAPVLAIVLGLTLVLASGSIDAQRRGRDGGRDERRGPEREVVLGGRTRMVVRGQEYFYSGGKYYRHGRTGFAVVAAPLGARIRVLPPGYTTVRIGRVPFFVSFGAYYQFDPVAGMYVVVQPPPPRPESRICLTWQF